MGQEGNSAFSAFVSYSHADKTAARKLHRKLEGYRLPKHVIEQLAGRDQGNGGAADGTADGRLGQIFRDREDLPAAQDLSESVKEALTGSAALVVLCSPAAKASPWVAREIQLFRELHPERPVLAALIEGEPADAFPVPLLQGGEPLAADLRKQGDGPRLGFLKVVAGIAGVPLDALVQRDAQRRLRRVTMITGGAIAAMLAMAIMTFIAIQSSFEAQAQRNDAQAQRNEARHQRAEAEKLVEFMITDLRGELKGRTTIRVMSKVNKRVLAYYEAQGDVNDLPDDSLGRWARLLHARGEDFEKQGKLDEALAKFTDAHRVTEALLERKPENPDRVFEHAQSEYWVGRIDELREDYSAAQKRYDAYAALAVRLHALEGDSKRAMMERAFAANNLGILMHQRLDRQPDARGHFQDATEWFGKVLKKAPDGSGVMAELANAHAWLADTHFREGNYAASKAQRLIENKLKRALLDSDPDNADAKMKWLISERAIAYIDIKTGHFKWAEPRLENAKSQALKLMRQDPGNAEMTKVYRLISDEYNSAKRHIEF